MHVSACIGRAMEVGRRNSDVSNGTDLVCRLGDHREEGYAIFFNINVRHSGVSLVSNFAADLVMPCPRILRHFPGCLPSPNRGQGGCSFLDDAFFIPCGHLPGNLARLRNSQFGAIGFPDDPLDLNRLSRPVEIPIRNDRCTSVWWDRNDFTSRCISRINVQCSNHRSVNRINDQERGRRLFSGEKLARENVARPF